METIFRIIENYYFLFELVKSVSIRETGVHFIKI
jgi:hypothetical protein